MYQRVQHFVRVENNSQGRLGCAIFIYGRLDCDIITSGVLITNGRHGGSAITSWSSVPSSWLVLTDHDLFNVLAEGRQMILVGKLVVVIFPDDVIAISDDVMRGNC